MVFLILLQLLLKVVLAERIVKGIRLDKKLTRCTVSCVCNDASKVVACREIDPTRMTVSLILEKGAPAGTKSMCVECFYRIKTAKTIEKIIQGQPDIEVVNVEVGDHKESVSLLRSISKGLLGLRTDCYYLVSVGSPQGGLLSKYNLIQLSQHGSEYTFCLSDGSATIPPDLQGVIYLYFNTIGGSYMINDIAVKPVPLDLESLAPSDYSKVLYYVFVCISTVNLVFVVFKGIRLARILLKKNE